MYSVAPQACRWLHMCSWGWFMVWTPNSKWLFIGVWHNVHTVHWALQSHIYCIRALYKILYNKVSIMFPYLTTLNKSTHSLLCLITFYWLQAAMVTNRMNQSGSSIFLVSVLNLLSSWLHSELGDSEVTADEVLQEEKKMHRSVFIR